MGIRELGRKLAYWFQRDRFAQELREEMRLHVDLRARKLASHGLPGEAAHFAARRQFGNAASYQDASSVLWGWTAWERLLQDLRQGVRMLRKSPGFAAIAIFTLALGLGINTAVFSLVNGVMLRSLPYPDPDRLVSIYERVTKTAPDEFSSSGAKIGGAVDAGRTTVSVANLGDYRRSRAFAGLAAYDSDPMNLTGTGDPERLSGEAVDYSYFSVLGVAPELGRAFLPEDQRPGAARVVIVSHNFWQRRLGGDTGVLARALMLDGQPYQVIGVLPRNFRSPFQLTAPDDMAFFVAPPYPVEMLTRRGDHDVNVVARLNAGFTSRTAQAELDVISARLQEQYPNTNEDIRAVAVPLSDDLVRNVRTSLLALLGASGLIVLITCVNVANLLLVRAVARRHESSVRLALGASRFRMVRQFLAESLLLAAAGCAAGLLLGRLLMEILLRTAPANIPRIQDLAMDWRVFAAATAVATLTGLIFGVAPAWQASQAKPVESLKTTARTAGGNSQARWRAVLTVAEVALSLVLIVGAGLLLKSFVTLMGVDLGFQPDRVLAMNVNLPDAHYRMASTRLQFFQQLESRVRTLPGVQSAAYANRMPLRGGWGGSIYVDTAPDQDSDVDLQAVSPGYFETLGIPLMRGRLLTDQDHTGQPRVAVVNQAFVRQYLSGVDPVGHQIRHDVKAPWVTVVGVVNDIRRGGKDKEISAQVYFPAEQTELYPVKLADFAFRTAGNPRQLVKAVQGQIWALDKDQPITNVRTMDEIITVRAADRRFQTLLLLIFAGVAVGLAVVGIFAVLSYAVNQRMSELGIRVALGAAPFRILRLVLRQAGLLIAAGVAFGLLGAYALTQYLSSLLFQVQPHDWRTYAAAVALLSLVSVVAASIPARRGAKVDPIVALRYE